VSKIWDAVQAVWSRYKPARPVVLLRTAAFTGYLGTEELTHEGLEQVVAAAAVIKQRYGSDARFKVYAVNSSMVPRYILTAQALNVALRPQTVELIDVEKLLVEQFLAKLDLPVGFIPVIVSGKPSVEELLDLAQQYGTLAEFGVPHFFTMERAKMPDIDRPQFKLAIDQPA
jgi:hypothetical protein